MTQRRQHGTTRDRLTVFDGATFSVGEVLAFLGDSRKSGVAIVPSPAETILIKLIDGRVVEARSSQSPRGCRLGDVLVRRGAVAEEDLDAFLAARPSGRGRLGRALAAHGLVGERELWNALRDQAGHLFRRCLDRETATVRFVAGRVPEPDVDLELGMQEALLEGLRLRDEAHRVAATS